MNFRRLKSSVIYRHPREGRERAIDQWDLHQPKVYCALTSEKCTTGLAPSGMIQTRYKYHLALSTRAYTATANSNRPKKPPNTSKHRPYERSRSNNAHFHGPPTTGPAGANAKAAPELLSQPSRPLSARQAAPLCTRPKAARMPNE